MLLVGSGFGAYSASDVEGTWREGDTRDLEDEAAKRLQKDHPLAFEEVEAPKPPAKPNPDAEVLATHARELVDAIEAGEHDDDLDDLEMLEADHKARVTVLEALTARRVAVRSTEAQEQAQRAALYASERANRGAPGPALDGAEQLSITSRDNASVRELGDGNAHADGGPVPPGTPPTVLLDPDELVGRTATVTPIASATGEAGDEQQPAGAAGIVFRRGPELVAEIERGDHDAYLDELGPLEGAGKSRVTVLAALDARRAKLAGG